MHSHKFNCFGTLLRVYVTIIYNRQDKFLVFCYYFRIELYICIQLELRRGILSLFFFHSDHVFLGSP